MTTKGPGLTLSRWFNHETSRIAMKHLAPLKNWQASRVILRSLRPPRWSGVRNFLGKLGRLSPKKTQVTKIWERTIMQREFATRFFGISFVPSLPACSFQLHLKGWIHHKVETRCGCRCPYHELKRRDAKMTTPGFFSDWFACTAYDNTCSCNRMAEKYHLELSEV